jgi:hypothetical protein
VKDFTIGAPVGSLVLAAQPASAKMSKPESTV